MTTFLTVFFSLIALIWLAALGTALWRRARPGFRLGPDHPVPADLSVRLRVVVPARDEVDEIEGCVDSILASELPGLRLIVLDDGSSDGTGEVLRRLQARYGDRLIVMEGGGAPLPQGWLGKPWACQRAARVALDDGADWLLFVDADVRLHAAAPGAAVAYAAEHGLGMLSGFGQVDVVSFWERVLQPVVVGLILAGNDPSRVSDPERRGPRPLANGQFILARRDAYEAVGGHEAVAAAVVDDVGMATAITQAGFDYHLVFMRELFRVRMYRDLAELWGGWRKNLFIGLGRSWLALAVLVGFNLVAVVLPLPVAVAGLLSGAPAWAWAAAAAAVLQQLLRAVLDRTFGQPALFGQLTHWLGQVMLVGLLLHSAWSTSRGSTTWKGRVLPS